MCLFVWQQPMLLFVCNCGNYLTMWEYISEQTGLANGPIGWPIYFVGHQLVSSCNQHHIQRPENGEIYTQILTGCREAIPVELSRICHEYSTQDVRLNRASLEKSRSYPELHSDATWKWTRGWKTTRPGCSLYKASPPRPWKSEWECTSHSPQSNRMT